MRRLLPCEQDVATQYHTGMRRNELRARNQTSPALEHNIKPEQTGEVPNVGRKKGRDRFLAEAKANRALSNLKE